MIPRKLLPVGLDDAEADTKPLTAGEWQLVECARTGKPWRPNPLDGSISPSPEERELRPQLIACLLVGGHWSKELGPWALNSRGLCIEGAVITGMLNLHGCSLLAPLWMKDCVLASGIRLRDAQTYTLGFNGCRIGRTTDAETLKFRTVAVDALRVQVNGNLHMGKNFTADGEVNLASARISGRLNCRGGIFCGDSSRSRDSSVALRCDAIEICDSVFLDGEFSASGGVSFEGAYIHDSLYCSGGTFDNAGSVALNCASIRVDTDVCLSEYMCHSSGVHPAPGGNKDICKHFHSRGEVVFVSAKIGNFFKCTGGVFECSDVNSQAYSPDDRTALRCDGIEVGGNVYLRRVVATGCVRFINAKIGNLFECSGGDFESVSFDNETYALSCTGIAVGGSVFMRQFPHRLGTEGNPPENIRHFCALGGVDFHGANVTGSIHCDGGRFINSGFPVEDRAYLDACQKPTKFNTDRSALCLRFARIRAGLYLNNIVDFVGCLNLEQATTQTIHDDGTAWMPPNYLAIGEGAGLGRGAKTPRNSPGLIKGIDKWINKRARQSRRNCNDGRLLHKKRKASTANERNEYPFHNCIIRSDGFSYQRFVQEYDQFHRNLGDVAYSKILIAWINCLPIKHLTDDFRPQPWEQMTKTMREMGHVLFSQAIAIEQLNVRARRPASRQGGWLSRKKYWVSRWAARRWHGLLRRTIGYGYRPQYAIWWSLLFVLIGWLTFTCAANLGYMAPRDGAVITFMAKHQSGDQVVYNGDLPDDYTSFNSFVFAVDLFLPVVSLGQDDRWEPAANRHGVFRVFPTKDGMSGVQGLVSRAQTIFGVISGKGVKWTRDDRLDKQVFKGNEDLTSRGVRTAAANVGDFLFRNGFHRFVAWFEVVSGWVFVSLLVASISGIIKR